LRVGRNHRGNPRDFGFFMRAGFFARRPHSPPRSPFCPSWARSRCNHRSNRSLGGVERPAVSRPWITSPPLRRPAHATGTGWIRGRQVTLASRSRRAPGDHESRSSASRRFFALAGLPIILANCLAARSSCRVKLALVAGFWFAHALALHQSTFHCHA